MAESENYIVDNGLPYCDYKIYRTKSSNDTPISKFRTGIRRFISIVRTFKTSALQEMLERVRDYVD